MCRGTEGHALIGRVFGYSCCDANSVLCSAIKPIRACRISLYSSSKIITGGGEFLDEYVFGCTWGQGPCVCPISRQKKHQMMCTFSGLAPLGFYYRIMDFSRWLSECMDPNMALQVLLKPVGLPECGLGDRCGCASASHAFHLVAWSRFKS